MDPRSLVQDTDDDFDFELPAGMNMAGVPDVDDIPLFMQSLPDDIQANDTLAAFQAMIYEDPPDEIAKNFKNHGNKCIERGEKYWVDAVKFYSDALDQPMTDMPLRSVIFSNRAHVYILQKNFGHAMSDARDAIAADPSNLKAYYRGAKAAAAVERWKEALEFSVSGLSRFPENAELKKEKKSAEEKLALLARVRAEQERKEQAERARTQALYGAHRARGVLVGGPVYSIKQYLSGSPTPVVPADASAEFTWPILFLYPQFQQSDFVQAAEEDNCIEDMLALILENPLPWDKNREYNINTIQVHYLANVTAPLEQAAERAWKSAAPATRPQVWKRVGLQTPLGEILRAEGHVVPALPVFHVTVANDFCKAFLKD